MVQATMTAVSGSATTKVCGQMNQTVAKTCHPEICEILDFVSPRYDLHGSPNAKHQVVY